MQVNQIYNSDYTGSCVWDLFCEEQEKLENSYSTAVRLMLGLPLCTHRYFLEPLSMKSNVKTDLIKRFMNFLDKIKKSGKRTLQYVLSVVSKDVRSVTGKNLVNIKRRCGKDIFENISARDIKISFREIPQGENWRIGIAGEILDSRQEKLCIPGFNADELDAMLTWICTTGPS